MIAINSRHAMAKPRTGSVGCVFGIAHAPAVSLDRSRGRFVIVAFAALLAASVCAAMAEEHQVQGANQPIAFHIPAQPLASALQAYGRMTGVQVLYESNSAIGHRSSAVDGDMTPEAALNALLATTDLRVQYIRPDAITLTSASAVAPGNAASLEALPEADFSLGTLRMRRPSVNDARYQEYSQKLQADIQNALRKNARTREGSYRAVMDIWINPSRMIDRTELSRSTGDSGRDEAIAAVLRGLIVSQPVPSNTLLPIRVAIAVRSLP